MHEITPATEKLLATVSSWKGRVSFQVNFTGRNLKPSPLFGHEPTTSQVTSPRRNFTTILPNGHSINLTVNK